MARVEEYRGYIQQVLEKYGSYQPAYGDVEVETIFDIERDHYQLVSVGWNGQQRVYGCVLHLDIKNGKIWVQHDGTEIGITNELVALGVPKEDIVLGFHAPYKRQYTGFAVN
jgi:hypothetical protein